MTTVDETSPTARALVCLELLQDSPGITATRLGARLGVSERAARRYVAVLREAGVPIESARGRYGGYRVGRGHRLPPLMFTNTEALALVMAVIEGDHAAGDPSSVPRLTGPVRASRGFDTFEDRTVAALAKWSGREGVVARSQ